MCLNWSTIKTGGELTTSRLPFDLRDSNVVHSCKKNYIYIIVLVNKSNGCSDQSSVEIVFFFLFVAVIFYL